jgi:arylsulfatase A-like enzyme
MRWRSRHQVVLAMVGGCLALGVIWTPQAPADERAASQAAPIGEDLSVAAGAPNILIINTDDQRTPGTLEVMPKVVRLFGQGGTSYTNGLVSTPLCCPSRSSLFSGRYSHNTGVTGNGLTDVVAAFDQDSTIQGYLQGAGYHTAMVGKYLTTVPLMTSPKHWDHWAHTTGGYVDVPFNVDGQFVATSGYYSNFMTSYAKSFLTDFESTDDQPWLLYVAPQAPHWNYRPSHKYRNAPLPDDVRAPSWNEADRSDKPPWIQWWANESESEYQDVRAKQLRTLMSVDDMVGSIFRQMTAFDETRNTLAIFMSDNGYLWGEHALKEKRYPYLESSEVPFLVRWPGHVARGEVTDRLVLQLDILPTLLEATGVQPTLTYPLDGQSFLSGVGRPTAFQEYFKSPDAPLRPWASLRGETWQYIEWYDPDTGDLQFREYYDLVNDPFQLVNLLRDGDDTNNPAVAPLHAELTAARTCVGDTCP